MNAVDQNNGYPKLSLRRLALGDKLLGIKKYLEKEQKELLFHRKSRREESEYFSFIKFLFSSPDEI